MLAPRRTKAKQTSRSLTSSLSFKTYVCTRSCAAKLYRRPANNILTNSILDDTRQKKRESRLVFTRLPRGLECICCLIRNGEQLPRSIFAILCYIRRPTYAWTCRCGVGSASRRGPSLSRRVAELIIIREILRVHQATEDDVAGHFEIWNCRGAAWYEKKRAKYPGHSALSVPIKHNFLFLKFVNVRFYLSLLESSSTFELYIRE